MSSLARLKYLHERKQELLVHSELQRRRWAAECVDVQQRLQWLDRSVTTARRILPWCAVAWPILRLWSPRRVGAGKSWLGRLATALPIAQQMARAWIAFRQNRDETKPEA